MTMPTETPASSLISPHVVGSAFVEQYYHVLHRSPELFYRFYQDSSVLIRPDSNGEMKSVTTTHDINDLVLSLDYKNYIAEILSVDSQQSYKDGVFILVTGFLTGQDKIRQKFSQSFFLAPQVGGGYFVLNDVFRFVDDCQQREVNQMLVNGANDFPAPLTPEQVASVQDVRANDPATPLSEGLPKNGEEVCDPPEIGGSIVEEEVTMDQVVQPCHIDTQSVSEITTSVVQEDMPKKSYASIVLKKSTLPIPVYAPTTKARSAPAKPEKPSVASLMPAPAPEITPSTAPEIMASSSSTSEKNNSHEEGHSIFIRNLPLNATAPQVEEELKKFGAIKPGGVQVRNHKVERVCFGFVEFESLDSMQAAIQASPVIIGGRQAFITEKKTTTRVNGVVSGSSGRGPYPGGRSGGGWFQNDNFRGGRGSLGGNQAGFVRNEFRNNQGSASSSGRGRGPPRGHAGDVYQHRIVQNGYGKMGRPNTLNQTEVAA